MAEIAARAEIRRADALVVGGGLSGLALATGLAQRGLETLLVEARPLDALLDQAFDGRSTAINRATGSYLEAIGAQARLEAAEPILDVRVADGFSPFGVAYDHRAVGGEPLGHIIENRHLRRALLEAARATPALEILAPAKVAAVELEPFAATIALEDGTRARAPLLAICEGRASSCRAMIGVEVERWDYEQLAFVFTLRHEKPHHGVAHERFFPEGPFALLPMGDRRCSVVWAIREDLGRELAALSDDAFLAEAAERVGGELGALALDGPRWRYPLSMMASKELRRGRAILVGDAARGVHPIAGQGWNLAMRDVASLVEIAGDRKKLGLDWGADDALAAYERWRRFDGLALIAVTDGLNRLFANDSAVLAALRGGGLAMVERATPLKRLFMQHAMGLMGDLPRSLRGEGL